MTAKLVVVTQEQRDYLDRLRSSDTLYDITEAFDAAPDAAALRERVIDALFDGGLADYSPDRADENKLADAVLAIFGDLS